MKFYRFDPEVGKSVDAYNSTGVLISRIAHLFEEAVVNCAYLEATGKIGYHQATIQQLFLVVQGEGWVRGESSNSLHSIKMGQAVYWEKGEWHESGTETGMTVIILEAIKVDPSMLTATV
ncbi:MAG TPA: cupin [Anaerolineae bacterium]|nr:cupin [Anaerolineae bacterium]